jgi:NADPH-dependent ferric siderophore reductase
MTETSPTGRIRREPPTFRRVAVAGVTPLTPRLVRVTVGGPELDGLVIEQPAASVRLLLPAPGKLDLEIVVHDGGAASAWAQAARPGDKAAISGPGRGYPIDAEASGFVLGGDESAIPAITQLLEVLPADKPVHVIVEVADPAARLELPKHPAATVDWYDLPAGAPAGDSLVAALTSTDLAPGTRIWAAGEAAAMQRIRRHLLDERSLPRSETWIRGYWKAGRAGDGDDD